jgi:hypothetical protein
MSSGPVRPAAGGRAVPFTQKFIDSFACGCVYVYWDNQMFWMPNIPGSRPDDCLIGETRERNMQDSCHKCDAEQYYKHIQSTNVEVSNWRQELKMLNEDENKESQHVDPNMMPPSPIDSDPPSSPIMSKIEDSTPAGDTDSNQHKRVITFGSFPAQEFPIRSSEDVQMPLTVAPRNNVQEETPAIVTTSAPDKIIVLDVVVPVITPKKLSYADVLKRKTITPRLESAEASLMTLETPVLECVKPVKPPFRQRLVFKSRALASNEPSSSGVVQAKDEPKVSHGVANLRVDIPLPGIHGLSSSEFIEDSLFDR